MVIGRCDGDGLIAIWGLNHLVDLVSCDRHDLALEAFNNICVAESHRVTIAVVFPIMCYGVATDAPAGSGTGALRVQYTCE